jgi:DNA-binding transcriptional LysR family regulator
MYGLYYVPKLIVAFRARHPGIEIVALQGSATQVRDMLEDGRIDVGILEERRIDASLQSERIGADEMVLALAADHALAHNKTIEARALNKMPMVVLTDDFLQRQLLDAHCARHKVAYQKVMECNFVHLTVLAALEGQGAATLLRSLVTSQPGLAGLSFRPKISFNFDFCWRKDRYLSKAAHALVRFGRAMPSDGKA